MGAGGGGGVDYLKIKCESNMPASVPKQDLFLQDSIYLSLFYFFTFYF